MTIEPDAPSESATTLSEATTSQPPPPPIKGKRSPSQIVSLFKTRPEAPSPAPVTRKRALSPAQIRKNALFRPAEKFPRTYTVEAICAIPHPVPTHALAASLCMTHLLTGSDDGYIRNYDIFSAVNSKNFLTAPQRHHSGVVEGIMKSGQLRFWWENPGPPAPKTTVIPPEEVQSFLAPVYSLSMHSDALWALAGTNVGHQPSPKQRELTTLVGRSYQPLHGPS